MYELYIRYARNVWMECNQVSRCFCLWYCRRFW